MFTILAALTTLILRRERSLAARRQSSIASLNRRACTGPPRISFSLLQLLDFLKTETDLPVTPSYDDWRPGDQPVYVSDIQKADDEFGWRPQVDWTEGVGKLVEWV